MRCAFCHEPDPAEDCEACPRCASVLHPECWAESGRCPTLGCEFVARDEDDEPATPRPEGARADGREATVGQQVGATLALTALFLLIWAQWWLGGTGRTFF